MAKESSVFKDLVIDKYGKQFIDRYDLIEQAISKHLSRIMDSLSAHGPTKRAPFTEMDVDNYFEAAGITREEILSAISQCKLIDPAWKKNNNEFYMLSTFIASVLYMNRENPELKKKKLAPHKTVVLYLAIRMYSSIQIRQFRYPPNEEVMDYTIDNLNNKFKIKQFNTIFELIKFIAESHIENMGELLENPIDKNLIYFGTNLINRISSSMINITNEYLINHRSGKRNNTDVNVREDDEGDAYVDYVANISTQIDGTVRRIRIKLSSDSIVDVRLLKIAAKASQLSANKMQSVLDKVRESKSEHLYNLILNIIAYYLSAHKKPISSIRTEHFGTTMIQTYRVSNTTNSFILKTKEILDAILSEASEEFLKTNRPATKTNMRFCVYAYIVLYIMKHVE